ncbi:MAG: C10 family peptidase [bacterium]
MLRLRTGRSRPAGNRTTNSGFVAIVVMVICVGTAGSALAEQATFQEMELACQNWLSYIVNQKGSWAGDTNPRIIDRQDIVDNDQILGRCFSIAPSGYIVVPILKDLPPIKMYSEESSLDVNKTDGAAQLLRQVLTDRVSLFAEYYGSLDAVQPAQGEVLLGREHRQQWDQYAVDRAVFENSLAQGMFRSVTGVGPLLTTSWHQGYPYYNYCPIGYGGSRCVVGCVATAAAQIMAYHRWPDAGYGSHSYWWDGDGSCTGNVGGGSLSADFFDTYDWANISDNCHTPCSEVEREALAELCYEVGVAFNMDYGVCGSGAYTAEALNVFPDHFRYRNTTDRENRTSHNSTSWFTVIKNEIDAGRPMQYRIYTHSIVCDGWNEPGGFSQYHFNYGWDDGHNAWYTLDDLHCPWDGCGIDEEFLIRYIEPDRGIMFTADTSFGWVPMEVIFTGESEHTVSDWMWDFGDGVYDTTVLETITHTYNTPGMFDVSLVIDTGGDTLSILRMDYVIALADSMICSDAQGSQYDTVEVVVHGRNTLPLTKLIIPIELSGDLATTHNYGGFSTTGCRTASFETQSYSHFDPGSRHYTIKLETSSTELSPGAGDILKLYFVVPASASAGKQDTVRIDGYSTYLPKFTGVIAEYAPVTVSSLITFACCSGLRGNVDGSVNDPMDVGDLTYLVAYIFQGGPAPPCLEEADVNGDGNIDVGDITCSVGYLFQGSTCVLPCP